MKLLIAALLGAGAWCSTAGGVLAAEPSEACRAALKAHVGAAFQAVGAGKAAQATTELDAVETACTDSPQVLAQMQPLRAAADLAAHRPAEAVARLDRAAIAPTDPAWTMVQAFYLSAYLELHDTAGFARVRTALLDANDRGLLAQKNGYWERVERFETPMAQVTAYRRKDPKAPRHTLFIAAPKADSWPMSFEVNEGGMDGLMASLTGGKDNGPPLGDLNACDMHATLAVSAKEAKSYEGLKGRATQMFSDPKQLHAQALSSSSAGATQGPNLCPGLMAVLPGLQPPESED